MRLTAGKNIFLVKTELNYMFEHMNILFFGSRWQSIASTAAGQCQNNPLWTAGNSTRAKR